MELFKLDEVTIITWFSWPSFPQTRIQSDWWWLPFLHFPGVSDLRETSRLIQKREPFLTPSLKASLQLRRQHKHSTDATYHPYYIRAQREFSFRWWFVQWNIHIQNVVMWKGALFNFLKSKISYGRIFESCLSIVSSYMTSILIYKNSTIFLPRQTVENAVLRWCKQKWHFEDIRINYTCVGEAPWYVSCPLLFTFTLNGTYFQIINREASCIMRNLQILDLLTDFFLLLEV